MSEDLTLTKNASKEERYKELLPQIDALIGYESDLVANMGNVSAALKYGFDFFWVGFYLVKDNELVLGPFQGPVACTRIKHGKGVCGTAFASGETVIVDDVDAFPGHIACSSLSKSEIVVPIVKNGEVIAVLDVDSADLATFDSIDKNYLEEIAKMVAQKF